jgi:hypothetical protein
MRPHFASRAIDASIGKAADASLKYLVPRLSQIVHAKRCASPDGAASQIGIESARGPGPLVSMVPEEDSNISDNDLILKINMLGRNFDGPFGGPILIPL